MLTSVLCCVLGVEFGDQAAVGKTGRPYVYEPISCTNTVV